MYVFPATHYVAGPERMERAIARHRGRAGGAARRAGAAGQAARGAAAADAHDLRHRDDAPGRLLLRHRELLAGTSTAAAPGTAPNTPARLLPRGLPARHRRVARDRAADRRRCTRATCRRKRTLVDHGFRLPSAMDNRPLRWEEFLERIGQTVYLSATPGPVRAGARATASSSRSSGRPAWSTRRSWSSRPRARSTTWSHEIREPGRAQRAGPGHHADQEDGRGPHRLPARARASGCATCTPRSTRCAGSSCCASCGWASSTCWSASTCCARASTCPRCRWSRSSTPTRRASCARRPR